MRAWGYIAAIATAIGWSAPALPADDDRPLDPLRPAIGEFLRFRLNGESLLVDRDALQATFEARGGEPFDPTKKYPDEGTLLRSGRSTNLRQDAKQHTGKSPVGEAFLEVLRRISGNDRGMIYRGSRYAIDDRECHTDTLRAKVYRNDFVLRFTISELVTPHRAVSLYENRNGVLRLQLLAPDHNVLISQSQNGAVAIATVSDDGATFLCGDTFLQAVAGHQKFLQDTLTPLLEEFGVRPLPLDGVPTETVGGYVDDPTGIQFPNPRALQGEFAIEFGESMGTALIDGHLRHFQFFGDAAFLDEEMESIKEVHKKATLAAIERLRERGVPDSQVRLLSPLLSPRTSQRLFAFQPTFQGLSLSKSEPLNEFQRAVRALKQRYTSRYDSRFVSTGPDVEGFLFAMIEERQLELQEDRGPFQCLRLHSLPGRGLTLLLESAEGQLMYLTDTANNGCHLRMMGNGCAVQLSAPSFVDLVGQYPDVWQHRVVSALAVRGMNGAIIDLSEPKIVDAVLDHIRSNIEGREESVSLIEQLKDDDPKTRDQSVDRLIKLYSVAKPLVKTVLKQDKLARETRTHFSRIRSLGEYEPARSTTGVRVSRLVEDQSYLNWLAKRSDDENRKIIDRWMQAFLPSE